MSGKKPLGRKPGDWKTIAAARERVAREIRTTRGVTNIPSVRDIGSAAYRRLMAARKSRMEREHASH
jgi:hypothetical protein